MKLDPQQSLQKLAAANQPFMELFKHGSLVIELYKPLKIDLQTPHDRDEVYIIVSGTGSFFDGKENHSVKAGDLFFVPATVEHRFENFSDDFSTWVIFYGPVGGEATNHEEKMLEREIGEV